MRRIDTFDDIYFYIKEKSNGKKLGRKKADIKRCINKLMPERGYYGDYIDDEQSDIHVLVEDMFKTNWIYGQDKRDFCGEPIYYLGKY